MTIEDRLHLLISIIIIGFLVATIYVALRPAKIHYIAPVPTIAVTTPTPIPDTSPFKE